MIRPALFTTLRALLAISVISLGMALGANSAAAEEAVVTTIPVSSSIVNPCTLEPVFYTAMQHMKVHLVATEQHEQGAVEVNFQNGKGVTALGATYVVTVASSTVTNAGPGMTSILQSHQNVTRLKEDPLAIAPSQTGDDWVVVITEKFTVNANGTVTVSHPIEVTTRCR